MIKLCKNIFYAPKYGNTQDSIMFKKLFSTVAVVFLCLVAISISAYAYFTYSVTSAANTIQATNFSISVSIETSENVPVTQGNIRIHHFEPGSYILTITKDSASNGTGFCIIRIGGVEYYTQQLGVDISAQGQQRNQIRFALDIQTAASVEIESRWGTTSYYDTAENPFYIMNTDPLQVITVNSGASRTENTPNETIPVREEQIPSTNLTTPEATTV